MMRRNPRPDNKNLRRRKLQQRRANRGAPHPIYYTECNPTMTNLGDLHAKR